jgi:DNA ligase-1
MGAIKAMESIHSTPILHNVNRQGRKKFWQGFVHFDGTIYYISTHSWQDLTDGGVSKALISVPKAVERRSQPTDKAQALFDLASREKTKRDEGYREEGEDDELPPLPMLAHMYLDRGHSFTYPAIVQPKYDGVRVLTDGTAFWSRKGILFPDTVVEHLNFHHEGYLVLDGEFMLPPGYNRSQIYGATKKFSELSEKLEIWVFDIVDLDLPDVERQKKLTEIFNSGILPANYKRVPWAIVKDEETAMAYYQEFLATSYEGIMFRNPDAMYEPGQRSPNLLKLKEFVDDEFLVVDVVDGKGSAEGAAIFVCMASNGEVFKAVPKGSIEERRLWFLDRENLIGNMLTVRYQMLSEDGIPLLPVGLGIRED